MSELGKFGSELGAGMEAAGFLSSILAGLLLDWWLDTSPWFVVIGIVAGSVSGFIKMWQLAKRQDDG